MKREYELSVGRKERGREIAKNSSASTARVQQAQHSKHNMVSTTCRSVAYCSKEVVVRGLYDGSAASFVWL